jgi:hypothetical protein
LTINKEEAHSKFENIEIVSSYLKIPYNIFKDNQIMSSKQIMIHALSRRNLYGFLSVAPETCCICGSHLTPYPIAIADSQDKLAAFFQKVYHTFPGTGKCGRLNIAVYNLRVEPGNTKQQYDFEEMLVGVPPDIPTREITPEIEELSPSFVLIYRQALATEALNLTQMTGLGLREALEFLVKDYAISKAPQDEEVIKKKPLGLCINEYLKDPYLKECARRAAWLGNDEAHYAREWKSHDVEDQKKLIILTLRWLQNSMLSEKYFGEMPP